MDTAVAFPFKAALVLLMAATTCSLYCRQHPLGLGKQHRLPVARQARGASQR